MSKKTPKRQAKDKSEGSPFTPLSPQFMVSPGRSSVKENPQIKAAKLTIVTAVLDLHRCIKKWEYLNQKFTSAISEIANVKLQAIFNHEQAQSNEEIVEATSLLIPVELQSHCNLLLEGLTSYSSVAQKIEQSHKSVVLERGSVDNHEEPIFKSWKWSDVCSTLEKISKMYQQELTLKKHIIEQIAHLEDRKTMMFYSAAWVQEPYLDNKIDLYMESLIIECDVESKIER